MVKYFFLKKLLCQETIREFICFHAPWSCMNTRIYLGMICIICSSIRMCE